MIFRSPDTTQSSGTCRAPSVFGTNLWTTAEFRQCHRLRSSLAASSPSIPFEPPTLGNFLHRKCGVRVSDEPFSGEEQILERRDEPGQSERKIRTGRNEPGSRTIPEGGSGDQKESREPESQKGVRWSCSRVSSSRTPVRDRSSHSSSPFPEAGFPRPSHDSEFRPLLESMLVRLPHTRGSRYADPNGLLETYLRGSLLPALVMSIVTPLE